MTKASNIKVLIVDDQITMRRIIRNLLIEIGFKNIEEAEDGKQALEKLLNNKYDLILSDWNMPIMSGIDLLKTVREQEVFNHQNTLFILITGEATPENILEAKKAKVDSYIVKPLTKITLKEKIATSILRKEMARPL